MNYQYIAIGILGLVVVCQHVKMLKAHYKITYYETNLENRGVNIDHVKAMSLRKMMSD